MLKKIKKIYLKSQLINNKNNNHFNINKNHKNNNNN
jgi:hypothetical protein